MFCDAHFHSSHSPPETDLPGSGLYISCASGPDDWQTLLNSENIIPFLGIHPERISKDWTDQLFRLEEIIKTNPRAGIGECGLDRRYYKKVSREEQEQVLLRQIEIAEKYKRPVALHQVKASGALADFLSRFSPGIPLMIHGFRESPEILKRYIELGMYISLGPGPQWNDMDFLETIGMIPQDKLLLETDWPYCSGAQNTPTAYSDCLTAHYREVSGKLGIDISQLKRLIKENGTLFTH